jgi:hypothetical protein
MPFLPLFFLLLLIFFFEQYMRRGRGQDFLCLYWQVICPNTIIYATFFETVQTEMATVNHKKDFHFLLVHELWNKKRPTSYCLKFVQSCTSSYIVIKWMHRPCSSVPNIRMQFPRGFWKRWSTDYPWTLINKRVAFDTMLLEHNYISQEH